MIGRSFPGQSKECISTKIFLGALPPDPWPPYLLSFEVSAYPDTLFFINHVYFIFLNLRVNGSCVANFMTEWRVVNWPLKYMGIQRLDARSPVGRRFLIVDSVVP